MDSDDYLFPRLLLGGASATKHDWKGITRTVWKDGHWRNVLPTLEMIPSGDCYEIYLSGTEQFPPPELPVWRMYRVGCCMIDCKYKDSRRGAAANDWLDGILISAMDHLWGVLGMLHDRSYFFSGERSISYNDVSVAYLSRLVRWMPMLDTLTDRLCDTLSWLSGRERQGAWVCNILHLTASAHSWEVLAGWRIDNRDATPCSG